ncbi:MAG: flagellin [Bradymonadia bacterium]
MGLYVNTNVASLNGQRRLLKSTNGLNRSFERLSSGLRINSAKDDAAGMSISTRMTAQIRGMNQAIRNTNDAISLAQTAEGALDETTNILQRMRELSIQAASDVNTATDRQSIDDEIQQLISELNRIGDTTTFNNQNILDGTFIDNFVQLGSNSRQGLRMSINDSRATALGRAAVAQTNAVSSQTLAANDLVINTTSIRATAASDDTVSTSLATSSAIAKASAINDSSAFTGVTARALETQISSGTAVAGGTLDANNYIQLNGVIVTGFTLDADDASDTLIQQINAVTDQTGVVASLDQNSQLQLTASDGRNIEVITVGNGGNITGLNGGAAGASVTLAELELSSDNQVSITGNNTDRVGFAAASIIGVNTANSVSTTNVLTREAANRTIDVVDRALEQVSSTRSSLGALQNRFESTIANLSAISENLSSSRSRIMDADFASESAMMTRNQILQQASTSILAQANQAPQAALSLIGG